MTQTIHPLTVTSKAPGHASHPTPHRVHTGPISLNVGHSGIESRGLARYQASQDGTPGGSVAATIQRAGTTHSVETVPGKPHTRTDVITAQRMGLIEPNGRGGWRDAGRR